jgi:hypothetical protein
MEQETESLKKRLEERDIEIQELRREVCGHLNSAISFC